MKRLSYWKCLELFDVLVLATLLMSCHDDPKDDPTFSGRAEMVGTYLVSVQGDVNMSYTLPLVGQQQRTLPFSLTDRTMIITPDSLHEDSVCISVDSIVSTKGEVVGNKLLINPTKINYSLSDLLESMNLGSLASLLSTYVGDAELAIRVYHSTATLLDQTLSLTTDIDASLEAASASLSIEGTLTDTAVKQ